jgi:pimeloyl-ACP methyl ester carboxylesterase
MQSLRNRLLLCVSGLAFALSFTPLAAGASAKYSSVAMTLKTKTGMLSGTLDLPAGKGPFPVMLLIAGSGPTDRNGNNPLGIKWDSYKLLGKGLAERGIAVLRYDKRGVGESVGAGLFRLPEFNTYVTDAADWIQLLRKEKRFSKVGIIGHSEGSHLASWQP